jgi:hypothetical protein
MACCLPQDRICLLKTTDSKTGDACHQLRSREGVRGNNSYGNSCVVLLGEKIEKNQQWTRYIDDEA